MLFRSSGDVKILFDDFKSAVFVYAAIAQSVITAAKVNDINGQVALLQSVNFYGIAFIYIVNSFGYFHIRPVAFYNLVTVTPSAISAS